MATLPRTRPGFPLPAVLGRLLPAARRLAWVALAGLGLGLGAVEAGRPAVLPGVVRFVEIPYGVAGDRTLRLDLYLPEGPAPSGGFPVILAIHGGGWRGGSRTSYGQMMSRFARHGVAVAAVDYRLSRPGAPSWPGNLDDLQAALGWLHAHAGEYDLDPHRVAAVGASAGGHLAALLGASGAVTASVDFYGPTDLAALANRPIAGEAVRFLLGRAPDRVPGLARAASPAHRVTSASSPMLLLYGTADPTVPPDQGRTLAAALDRAGVPGRLVLVEGAGHGFGLTVAGRDLLPEILAFVRAAWDDRDGAAAKRPSGHRHNWLAAP